MPPNLDHQYPQGNPTAVKCRACEADKVAWHGGLICPECDGPIQDLETRPRKPPTEPA